MIDPAHDLSITKQAEALNISRGSVYYLPRPVPGDRRKDQNKRAVGLACGSYYRRRAPDLFLLSACSWAGWFV
jgi:hypothetical protein